jgi:catechol 2,3-dioxygenase-like lactoylglutathione lyase family enzyme
MAGLEGAARLQAVNHLTYNVTDKARALRFWEDVLGTKQIPSQVALEHIIWLQLPSGTMVHLIENPESPSVPSHHGAFEVDDVDAAATALQANGLETTPIVTRNDGQRTFNVFDPDGNRIEICTKSGFGVLV